MTASAQGCVEYSLGFDLGLDIDLVFVSVWMANGVLKVNPLSSGQLIFRCRCPSTSIVEVAVIGLTVVAVGVPPLYLLLGMTFLGGVMIFSVF